MFGDLLGNMEEKQKVMKEKLNTIILTEATGDGAIQVTANANREITNISIKKEAIDLEDMEQLEDLLMVAINRVLEKAAEQEAIESQKMMKDMMPPGLGGLGDLFGS
ncbi:MAG: YbaB/EbfC family nucleoid-associated protein [Saprospiraceae bacterium]